MTVVSSGECGREIRDQTELLDVAAVASTGETVSRSTSAVSLDAEGCADPGISSVELDSSCDPGEFPWLAGTAITSKLLYALGVRTVKVAVFEVNGSLALRQTILELTGSKATAQFREHLEGCGARPLATANGNTVQYELGGQRSLTVSLHDGRLDAVQALDGKDRSRLLS